jgi:hypothetical protein
MGIWNGVLPPIAPSRLFDRQTDSSARRRKIICVPPRAPLRASACSSARRRGLGCADRSHRYGHPGMRGSKREGLCKPAQPETLLPLVSVDADWGTAFA